MGEAFQRTVARAESPELLAEKCREPEPVTHVSLFKRIKNYVTDSNVNVNVKLHDGASAHDGLNWVARSNIWSAVAAPNGRESTRN